MRVLDYFALEGMSFEYPGFLQMQAGQFTIDVGLNNEAFCSEELLDEDGRPVSLKPITVNITCKGVCVEHAAFERGVHAMRYIRYWKDRS